jgi:hypothetical protein
MGPNEYQKFLMGIVAVLWLGGGNLIIYDAIRKKRLSFVHMLNPFIIFKFDKRDWGKVLLLIASIIGLSWLSISLESTTEPDKYQLILIGIIAISICLIAVLSIGAVFLKIYGAVRVRKKKIFTDMLNAFGIFNFDKRDWIHVLILIILAIGLLCLIILFYLK